MSRRETLRRGLVAAGVLAPVPEWALPALAQGEIVVPTGANRFLDIRTIDGLTTPNDQFFFIQHYNKPEIDPAAYRLTLTGLVNRPVELTLADLKAMKSVEIVNGYECSGNSARATQGLVERPVHGGAPSRRAQAGRRGRPGTGRGVLRHRSWQGRRDVPSADVQDRAAVRAQHHARARDEAGAAAGFLEDNSQFPRKVRIG